MVKKKEKGEWMKGRNISMKTYSGEERHGTNIGFPQVQCFTYIDSLRGKRTFSGQALCVCVCVQSRVSALTLSGDITVRQYRGDNVEPCHSRRAKEH